MKRITFYPKNETIKELVPPPQKVEVPDWFKKIPLHTDNEKKFRFRNGNPNYSVKACMPFLDTFMTGYTFNLPCDVFVELDTDGRHTVNWHPALPAPITGREFNQKLIPHQKGHDDWNFSWLTHWGIKLPKGYSALLTHPLNRTDLPFITSSGIMDADTWGIWGNQPFSFQSGFEGVIPAGTPIIQIIPFKRHSWHSRVSEKLSKWANFESLRRGRTFRGYYKDNYWSKKDFV